MKIKITTKNRLGLSKEILALLAENEIDVIKVEVETGLMYLETEAIDKLQERKLASQIMKIDAVKWVESISLMPSYERNLFLTSLLNAISDPVLGINNKGKVIYQNEKAQESFKLKSTQQLSIKDIFTQDNWAEIIDTAASGTLPVNIKTISGPMLVEVRAINQKKQKTIGAVLVLHKPENITARSYVIEGAEIQGFESLIVESSNMLEIVNRSKHMSDTSVPLLLNGESGVGKKTIAQAIHHKGSRKNKLFSSLNFNSIKPSQMQAELFGMANPVSGKAGLLEMTEGGTLYLDSIQNMSDTCQNKLLEFLNERKFTRVNGKIERQSDVKIIASSSLPLKTYVENKQFNSELFYALDITQLSIPSLRERTDEIEPLIAYFLQLFHQQGGKQIIELSFAALNKVKSYFWPGNITQLKDVIYKASIVTEGNIIEAEHIDIDGHVQIESTLENRSLPQAVAEFEKHFLQHWYQKYSSTRKLAQHLGVSHTTIAQKLNRYEIN
jgi:transcriptional regulator of aroF, aroG, tyrA and aromatic amino acid transport